MRFAYTHVSTYAFCSDQPIANVLCQAFTADASGWKPMSDGHTQLVLYHNAEAISYSLIGLNLNDNSYCINIILSYNGSQYTTPTETFHQLIDSGNVYGFNFLSADDAKALGNAMSNAIMDLMAAATKPPSQPAPPPPPPQPTQQQLESTSGGHSRSVSNGGADSGNSDGAQSSLAASIGAIKLKKSPSKLPDDSATEKKAPAAAAAPASAAPLGGLFGEMQSKLNKKRENQNNAPAAPAQEKSEPAPAQTDFRSQLKAKLGGQKQEEVKAPTENAAKVVKMSESKLPADEPPMPSNSSKPDNSKDEDKAASAAIDTDSIFNRFKQPEAPKEEEKPKGSRGFRSVAPPPPKEQPKEDDKPVNKKKQKDDDEWDDAPAPTVKKGPPTVKTVSTPMAGKGGKLDNSKTVSGSSSNIQADKNDAPEENNLKKSSDKLFKKPNEAPAPPAPGAIPNKNLAQTKQDNGAESSASAAPAGKFKAQQSNDDIATVKQAVRKAAKDPVEQQLAETRDEVIASVKPQLISNKTASSLSKGSSLSAIPPPSKEAVRSESKASLKQSTTNLSVGDKIKKSKSQNSLASQGSVRSRGGSKDSLSNSRRGSRSDKLQEREDKLVLRIKNELMYEIRKELGDFKREVIEAFQLEIIKLADALTSAPPSE